MAATRRGRRRGRGRSLNTRTEGVTRTRTSVCPMPPRLTPVEVAGARRAVRFDRQLGAARDRGGADAVPAGGGVGAVREFCPHGGAGGWVLRTRAGGGRGLPRDRLGGSSDGSRPSRRGRRDPLLRPHRRGRGVPAGRHGDPAAGGHTRALHRLDAIYRRRIGAMEFTLCHDDGLGLETLAGADVVLVGGVPDEQDADQHPAAQQGYRAANVSLATGIAPPAELLALPRTQGDRADDAAHAVGVDPRSAGRPPGGWRRQRTAAANRSPRNWPGAASSFASRGGR